MVGCIIVMDYKKELHNLYFNPSSPASFSSLKTLFQELKKRPGFEKVPHKQVKEWLEHQQTYTLHGTV